MMYKEKHVRAHLIKYIFIKKSNTLPKTSFISYTPAHTPACNGVHSSHAGSECCCDNETTSDVSVSSPSKKKRDRRDTGEKRREKATPQK